jgi:tetratricopeptide (TPR) repeat protein
LSRYNPGNICQSCISENRKEQPAEPGEIVIVKTDDAVTGNYDDDEDELALVITPLQAARRAKGWSQARAVWEITNLAAKKQVTVASARSLKTQLSRWENGHIAPDYYRPLLRELFGLKKSDFTREQTERSAEFSIPLTSKFGQSESLKFGLNLDDEERIIQAARRPMRVDRSVVTPLAKILAAQRETEDVIGSMPLIKPVTSQLAMLEDLVKESRGPSRPEIIDIAAQWAEYSGWLYTSTGHWQDASAWFDRTSEWAAESGNPTLAATSLSFKGHVAFLLGQIGPMIGLTQAALRGSDSWVGQRAYDAHQLARGLAIAGDSEEAVRTLEEGRSLALIAHERSDEKPPWIYYYTLPFYALERGFVYRFLGRDNSTYNNEAIASLSAALNDIGDARSSEWAAEYIYHLAVAYMQAGSPDKACETALEVLRIASATESNRLIERLHGIYARLAKRWPNEPCVKELGEALR